MITKIIILITSDLADLFITSFIFIPLITFFLFFCVTTFFLFYSLKNIFKIFFLTEALLLIIVIFLLQTASIYPDIFTINYFYCQIILAAAAAEAALFLGIFSHLYDQQFTN